MRTFFPYRNACLLLSLALIACANAAAQDSTHYSVFWKPETLYRNAGVTQEGVFVYGIRKGVVHDSTLVQTFLYDSLGRLLRQHDFRNGRVRTQLTYRYTGNHIDSLLQEERWLGVTVRHKFTYDSANRLVLQEMFSRGRKTMHHRFVYNGGTQPRQRFTQGEEGAEFLSAETHYRADRLMRQVDYRGERDSDNDGFSRLYQYGNRTVTVFFQHPSTGKRYVEAVSTYNAQQQVVQKLYPPLEAVHWLPLELTRHRDDEEVEMFSYHPNGLLFERRRHRGDALVFLERHFYF